MCEYWLKMTTNVICGKFILTFQKQYKNYLIQLLMLLFQLKIEESDSQGKSLV